VGLAAGLVVANVADATGVESALTHVTNSISGVAISHEYSGAPESLVTDTATSGWESSNQPAANLVGGRALGGAVMGPQLERSKVIRGVAWPVQRAAE